MPDDFYTGYLPQVPPGIARRIRLAAIGLLVLAAAVALVLIAGQKGFSAAVYEFGVFRDFEGVIEEAPYPTLALARPGRAGVGPTSRFYLVGPGKLGAAGEVEGLDGRRVKLRGSLIYRDDQTMIELEPGSVTPADGAAIAVGSEASLDAVSLGTWTLRGRIVDSKCFLGIMKPGATKPHRACATRCIAGGIPPLFVASDRQGPAAYLMLVGADGRAVNQEVLEMVDEPLEITGEVSRLDDLWILESDPATYRRL